MKDARPGKRASVRPRHGGARRKIIYAPVTFSEQGGVRFLHFGTEWIQGAMRIARPDAIELEYAQQMMAWTLFIDAPRSIAQLGLGAAALTKFCHRQFPEAQVTAVELNEAVVLAARAMFRLPPDDERLSIIAGDAEAYVDDAARHASLDALQVDLYDATARGPVLESTDFYSNCRACLKSPGVLTVNLFGDHASFDRNMRHLADAFEGRVLALPEVHEGNRVAIAFHGPPLTVPWTTLRERAALVARRLRLPASSWVDGLHAVASLRKAGSASTTFRI